ncbi:hypothetical protein [Desulfosporosinus youngiae]|uniref:Transposase n=1 Tax=Desulfosporosinus youngiae DSM 17734 TaxID=768710 RepID=H5XWS7_9FIRM|nr:hypothetical protein [Desulfosporosinus youngiae]EHQ90726.1 hypothetical protein DesyoDRAFT_3735 [Desulfosporosinus youngiae DSM 17734]
MRHSLRLLRGAGFISGISLYLPTEGMEKGIKKGMEEGMEKGKLEVAENLLGLGMDVDMIKATGLAEEEIRKLMN